MILKVEELKDICSTVLTAVDSNELSILTETLELNVTNNILYLTVTNREYYAQFKLNVNTDEDFHATVNANLFLSLIAKTTTEEIELTVDATNLNIKGNGRYKMPLIYDNDQLLVLPKITLNNITSEFDIDGNILVSILNYNSKQLNIGSVSKPIQKMYYVDNQGAITFTSGACVNNFTLEQPVKMLLNNRLVKLFKLFKSTKVHFKLAYDNINNDIMQTKVSFESDNVLINAILSCDDTMINSVPAAAIRNRATADYDYSVVFNRFELMQTIERLLLFAVGYGSKEVLKPYSRFVFDTDKVIINDVSNINKEEIKYSNNSNISDSYEAYIDLTELKAVLESCTNEYITICFGDHQAFVVARDSIYNVIPECNVIE